MIARRLRPEIFIANVNEHALVDLITQARERLISEDRVGVSAVNGVKAVGEIVGVEGAEDYPQTAAQVGDDSQLGWALQHQVAQEWHVSQGGVVGDETVHGTEAVIRHARFHFRGEPIGDRVSTRRSEADARIELDRRAGDRSKKLRHVHVFGKGRPDVAPKIKPGHLALGWLWREQTG